MKLTTIISSIGLLGLLSSCRETQATHHEEAHPVIGITLEPQEIRITEDFVSQIHSSRHIEVAAVESGYLKEIPIKEGQTVEKGDTLFQIVPAIYQAEVNTKKAEARVLELKYINTGNLAAQGVVSENEVALAKAEFDKAQSEVELARAHLNFTDIKAPFGGIIDRFELQEGSFIEEDMPLTTLSDNSIVWVYFNVSEARYLEYQAIADHSDVQVELVLANGKKFDQAGEIAAIEADFNNETGNIAFRADFPNPKRLLRNGQTGTIELSQLLKDAIVVPQRSTFEVLDKRYVYIIDEEGVVHQQLIEVLHDLEDILVVGKGLEGTETIVYEGIRGVHDGEKVEHHTIPTEEVMNNLKQDAE